MPNYIQGVFKMQTRKLIEQVIKFNDLGVEASRHEIQMQKSAIRSAIASRFLREVM